MYGENHYMLDLNRLEQYHENNRIEAKKALGGLPHSIWETYSAFANTMGGVILLGVREDRDKSFHAVDLPDPERMKQEFWNLVNDPQIASVNILSLDDIRIENFCGKKIIMINVPRAERTDKPVYVEGSPNNTFRRSGEGDYRCTPEEYQAMLRDASLRSQDMQIAVGMRPEVFDPETISAYRRLMKISHPGHIWENLDDEGFLLQIGALSIGTDGISHPTCAGLLMFGTANDIVREFPYYLLDYRVESRGNTNPVKRIVSSSCDWSGNVLDFYFRVFESLQQDLCASSANEAVVQGSVCETVLNSLINADYYGLKGVVIIKREDVVRVSNPGVFRIALDKAKHGGISDPRNTVIAKMFSLIKVGEQAGCGISGIFKRWKDLGLREPEILQMVKPERTIIVLPLLPYNEVRPEKKSAGTGGDFSGIGTGSPGTAGKENGNLKGGPESSRKRSKKAGKDRSLKIIRAEEDKLAVKQIKRRMIVDYLTEHIEATTKELSAWLDLTPSRVRVYLRELIRDGIVIPRGQTRSRVYKLKA